MQNPSVPFFLLYNFSEAPVSMREMEGLGEGGGREDGEANIKGMGSGIDRPSPDTDTYRKYLAWCRINICSLYSSIVVTV